MKIAPSTQAEQLATTSLDDNNPLPETAYLLCSPANAEHLNKSIAQFKADNAFKRRFSKNKYLEP